MTGRGILARYAKGFAETGTTGKTISFQAGISSGSEAGSDDDQKHRRHCVGAGSAAAGVWGVSLRTAAVDFLSDLPVLWPSPCR